MGSRIFRDKGYLVGSTDDFSSESGSAATLLMNNPALC